MAYRISIEVEVSFDIEARKSKEEAMLGAARMAAKHIYSTAALLSDSRKPDIKLFTDDMIEGKEEINLAPDFETE